LPKRSRLEEAKAALLKLEKYWEERKEKALEDQRAVVRELEEKENTNNGIPKWL
jgi:hypothetical protein